MNAAAVSSGSSTGLDFSLMKRHTGAGPVLVKEVIPAAADSDTATQQTIATMCRYAREGASDPVVHAWADNAVVRYGRTGGRIGLDGMDPAADVCAWADFWAVKHGVKYVRDEPRLFRMGDGDALDLLTAPAVLARQSAPKEDCDGFTMLLCAMLLAQGVECYMVTVAASPDDPGRWSHVFAMARLSDGSLLPLDASHGAYPGWMVPRPHIFRWQAWDMNGRPVDAFPTQRAKLAGYARPGSRMIRRRGIGEDVPGYGDVPVTPPVFVNDTPAPDFWSNFDAWLTGQPAPPLPGSLDTATPPVLSTSSTSKPIDWGSIISNAINGATKVAQVAFLPTGATVRTGPGGTMISNQGGSFLGTSVGAGGLGSMLPILLIGGVVLLAASAMAKKSS